VWCNNRGDLKPHVCVCVYVCQGVCVCVLTRVLQAMTTAHTVHVEVCNPAYSDLLMKSDLKRKT